MNVKLLILSVPICVAILTGCTSTENQPPVAVPTPQMPDGWQVAEDFQLAPTQLIEISAKMNADLLGIRNTSFEVEGLRIKVNTLIAGTNADAEKAMTYMKANKSEQALLQRGLTIYEFVGSSEINHLIPVGRQFLAGL